MCHRNRVRYPKGSYSHNWSISRWVGAIATQDKAGINLRCPLHQSRYLHGIKARNELWVKPIVCGLAIILWHLTDLFSQVVIVPISDACRTQERWIETSVTREKWISFTLEAALLSPSDRKLGHPRNEQYPGFSWHTVPFWGVNTRFIYTPTYGKRCKFRTWKSSVTSNRVQANSTAPQAFHTPGVKLCPGYLMASQTASDSTLWCWKQEEWVLKSPRFSVRNIWSAYCFSWTTQCTSTEDELPFKKWEICFPLQYNFHNVIFKCT